MNLFTRFVAVLSLIAIGINLSIMMQSCTRDNQVEPVYTQCELAHQHISECTLKTDEYIIYFPNWDEYCKEETPEKFLEMECSEIIAEFFDGR